MAHMATSSANLVAREKAREAVESVHTARDTRTITWCQIYNVTLRRESAECTSAAPGVFLDGAQPLKDPGADGLVNTADDGGRPKSSGMPGPDGILGNADDVHVPMTNYTRTILISNLTQDDGTGINQDLRMITVTITYNVGPVKRSAHPHDLHLADFVMKKNQAGFTLIEMMITMGLTLIIMGSTLAAMNNAMRASELATLTTNMNQGLRTAMDIIVRDMLQVGQGLPSGRTIDIPNGAGATRGQDARARPAARRAPTSPRHARCRRARPKSPPSFPEPGAGPTINGVADRRDHDGPRRRRVPEHDQRLRRQPDGADRDHVHDGRSRGRHQQRRRRRPAPRRPDHAAEGDQHDAGADHVASTASRRPRFAVNDSLNLNQTAAAFGTLTNTAHRARPKDIAADVNASGFVPSTATRIRMVSYYIDAVDRPGAPAAGAAHQQRQLRHLCDRLQQPRGDGGRLRRREPADLPTTWSTASTNPSEVKINAPIWRARRRLRSQRVLAEPDPQDQRDDHGRSRTPMRQTRQYFRNTLTTQVSLRSMSFMDRYK